METISENILFREKVKEHTNKPQHEHQQNQREQLQEHTKAGEILGHLISLEQYLAFNTIVNKIDEIELAIELYTAGRLLLREFRLIIFSRRESHQSAVRARRIYRYRNNFFGERVRHGLRNIRHQ